MNAYRKILLLCDPMQRETAAMQRAKKLALASKACLHLVILDDLPSGLGSNDSTLQTKVRRETQKRQEHWLSTQSE